MKNPEKSKGVRKIMANLKRTNTGNGRPDPVISTEILEAFSTDPGRARTGLEHTNDILAYFGFSDGEERSDRFHVDYWESEPGKVGVQFLRITGDHIDRSFPEMFSIDSPEGVAEAVAKWNR